jgi:DNA-binding IclR family transcriptional regulator
VFKQQELARLTGLDDGFTSRIVHRLEADGLVQRDEEGAVRVDEASRLLDSWSEVYDFEKP